MAEQDFLAKDSFLESIHKARFKPLPEDFKALSAGEIAVFNRAPHLSPYAARQEPGTRPSCALPYCLHAEGGFNADRSAFEIVFSNNNDVFGEKTAGAPFNVYAPGSYAHPDQPGVFETARTWAYAAKAGDTLTDSWPLREFGDNRYHLRVYGPNGFFREFKGDAGDPAIDIRFGYEPSGRSTGDSLSGNGVVHLKNHGGEARSIEFIDHSYKAVYPVRRLAAGEEVSVTLPFVKNRGWYDFSARVKGLEGFEKRYAGRIETGRDSISDPHMGRTELT